MAALVPPPRIHRHRYFGVLAPHSPLRAAVTALAVSAATAQAAPPPNPSEPAAELDALRQKRGFAANNFQADGVDRLRGDRALADQMRAVSAKYRERAEPSRRRIGELHNEQKTLTSAAK